jgi:electron transfer flavoprotein beta subunit
VGELLGIPVVTFARKVEVSGGIARIERVLPDGFETLEAELPALVTVSNELGAARKPNLRETMRAARKPLVVKSAAEIGLAASEIERVSRLRVRERLFVPVKSGRCEIIEGSDEIQQAARLAHRLREARLV